MPARHQSHRRPVWSNDTRLAREGKRKISQSLLLTPHLSAKHQHSGQRGEQ
jgi:hypothetical protein